LNNLSVIIINQPFTHMNCKFLFTAWLLLSAFCGYTQIFSDRTPVSGFTTFYKNVGIHVSLNGDLTLSANIDHKYTLWSGASGAYRRGRIKPRYRASFYYDRDFNTFSVVGRLRPIAASAISYYGTFDRDELMDKLKTLGDLKVTYYDVFDRDELLGKVKTIGDLKVTYYDVFDRDELRGKVKTIGNMKISYNDVFDNDNIGKLKNMGDYKVAYYGRFDADENMGRVKAITGYMPQVHLYCE
jgi:hypothetical protein